MRRSRRLMTSRCVEAGQEARAFASWWQEARLLVLPGGDAEASASTCWATLARLCWPSQVYILKACGFMSHRFCLKFKSMQWVLNALGRRHLSLKGLEVASGSGASQPLHRTPSLNILDAPLTDLGP
mmetsp:Transcript_76905/g.249167  ORF Transcript_76905/g.249167 Transcript_76905/m.249167 type:complete len:127 (+) Transcript_76905:594-974(+)